MKKKIVIFGAGISSLTIAHELSKNPLYDINIYEKLNTIGGLARSGESNCCDTELSWRGYYGFYEHIPRIMKEIPTKNGTVHDHLVDYKGKNFSSQKLVTPDILLSIISGLTSCTDRLKAEDKQWGKVTKNNSSLKKIAGPWLGLDREKASFYSIITIGIEQALLNTKTCKVLNGPTNKTWFNPWKTHLMKNGVKFFMNHELSENSKIISDEKLRTVSVFHHNGNNIVEKFIDSDYFIFAVPIQVLQHLKYILSDSVINNIKSLCKNDLQTQVGFQLKFNKKINIKNINGFFMLDSNWNLAILIWDKVYKKDFIGTDSIWSISVCYAYAPGINGKTFEECTYEEMIYEIWNELVNCDELVNSIEGGLDKSMIKCWGPLWPGIINIPNKQGYASRSKKSQIINTEPIPTNNVGTLELRPSILTNYDNTFISNGYVKETTDIFSMEGAGKSGVIVANNINKMEKISDNIPIKEYDRPVYLSPFRLMDNVYYNMGVPNMWVLSFMLIIILICSIASVSSHFYNSMIINNISVKV